ncbi:HD-GYP domain-containing protein [Paenibacillus periandrae]|uniref:HD-GYP domain-containing protein n=1 Tax=Paenibacillus periandrae TaxID=1761741 RepID=UPI001F089D97|nr:HD domain-containing phosphohydrolase [Paenibacillus periandrae]
MFQQLLFKYKDQVEWEKGRALFLALEYRCQATAEHSVVVAFIAYHLAIQINCDTHTGERMFLAGLLHDIGKLKLPDDILKSQRLITSEEHQTIVSHVQGGYDALKVLGFGSDILQFCLTHHERLDGSGYPQGISERSMIGKIAPISDVYSALKLPRLYRPSSLNDEHILKYFIENNHQFEEDYIQELLKFLTTWRSHHNVTEKLSV